MTMYFMFWVLYFIKIIYYCLNIAFYVGILHWENNMSQKILCIQKIFYFVFENIFE